MQYPYKELSHFAQLIYDNEEAFIHRFFSPSGDYELLSVHFGDLSLKIIILGRDGITISQTVNIKDFEMWVDLLGINTSQR